MFCEYLEIFAFEIDVFMIAWDIDENMDVWECFLRSDEANKLFFFMAYLEL